MKEQNAIHHVLIADDDRDQTVLFKKILLSEYPSLKICSVQDGKELIRFLRLNPIDLVFLDLKMPCMNGYECLQEIKNNPSFEELPIVVYSSSAQLSDIQKSFLHNADFYLVKPFNTDHLKKAIQMIFSVDWKDDPPIKRHYFINNSFVPFTDLAC